MSKITFDATGERLYETGVKNCALYVKDSTTGAYSNGVAWNGIINITEKATGAEATKLYADDMNYVTLMSLEEFGFSIEAYMYPDAFKACNGEGELGDGIMVGQQERSEFGLCYRTVIGNDEAKNSYGYKLHLIYGALASPSEKAYASINESPEAITMSWECTTTPIAINKAGFKPTSVLTIDSTKVDTAKLASIEAKLYGSDEPSNEPTLLTPDEIVALLAAA